MVKYKDMWLSDRTLSLATKKKALKNELMQLSGCLLEQKKLEYTELVKAVRKSCRHDKEVWWSQKAQEVERSATDGRLKDTFGILKQLAMKPGRPCCTLKGRNGQILENDEQIIARWTEHFRDLLKTDVNICDQDCDNMDASFSLEKLLPDQMELVRPITFEDVVQAVKRTSKGKSPGYDEITVEMLQSRSCLLWLFRLVRVVWETGFVRRTGLTPWLCLY